MKCLVSCVVATLPGVIFCIRADIAAKTQPMPRVGIAPKMLPRPEFVFDELPENTSTVSIRVDAPKSIAATLREADPRPMPKKRGRMQHRELNEQAVQFAIFNIGVIEAQIQDEREQVNGFISRVFDAVEQIAKGDEEISRMLIAYDHENTNRNYEHCQNAANQRFELRMQEKARTSHKEHQWHLEHQQKLIALDATRKRWANNDAARDHYLDAWNKRFQHNIRSAMAAAAQLAELNTRIDAQVAIERAKSESQVEALYLQHRIREKELNELGRQAALQRKHALDQDESRREDEKMKRRFAAKRARQKANENQRMLQTVLADQRHKAELLDRRAARERGFAHALASTDAMLADQRSFRSYRSALQIGQRNHEYRMQLQQNKQSIALMDALTFRKHGMPAGFMSSIFS